MDLGHVADINARHPYRSSLYQAGSVLKVGAQMHLSTERANGTAHEEDQNEEGDRSNQDRNSDT